MFEVGQLLFYDLAMWVGSLGELIVIHLSSQYHSALIVIGAT